MSDPPGSVPIGASRPLVWSKLQPPVPRARVPRPSLVRRCATPEARLVLIRAPAGSGKSTLLADWHASELEHRDFAWLALDRDDNDPVRFWTYLIAAIHGQHEQVGEDSAPALLAPRVDIVEDVIPLIIDELRSRADPLVVVLDDYHLVTNSSIDASLAYFATHLPHRLVLVMATRSEPALPLARLRAQGALIEIDAQDLRFSEAEALALLNDLNTLHLNEVQIEQLLMRTEGWAAGLYLAALTLRGHDDATVFIEQFAGDDRHVVDYLSQEVLATLPEVQRRFLAQTALLDRLCAGLCDAVTERTDSAQVLAELETTNSFLIPLDTRREWFRYHHLFGELLRLRVAAPDAREEKQLHHRAATWYRERGFVSDAIRHAAAAGDLDAAGQLIADNWNEARDSARLATLLAWVDTLPEDHVRSDARLCLVRAATLQELGRLEEADRWLAFAAAAEPGGAAPGVATGVAACRAINAYFYGDVGAVLDIVDPALGAGADDYWSSALLTTKGAALFLQERKAEADATLREAVSTGEATEHHLAAIHALGWLSVVQHEVNDLGAASLTRSSIDRLLLRRPGLADYYGAAMAHVAAGLAAEARGDSETAEAEYHSGVQLARRGNARLEEGYALLALSALLIEENDPRRLGAPQPGRCRPQPVP